MGGPGTASLLSAIGGAGASTAGALTGKGDAGQPLVSLSQSLNQQDQQRAQLAQQQQQNALQLRRQDIQDARQNFYIQQAGKTFKLQEDVFANTKENQGLMNALRKDAAAKDTKKDAEKTAKEQQAAAEKLNPVLTIQQGLATGAIKPEDVTNIIDAGKGNDKEKASKKALVFEPPAWYNPLGFGGPTLRKDIPVGKASQEPASGQPKVFDYNPKDKTIKQR